MTEGHPPAAPWMFETIGWSWLVLSAIGLIFNIFSLAFIPSEDTIHKLLAPFVMLNPADLAHVGTILSWALPVTALQMVLSVLATWASWAFLKRENWGRLVLAVMNWGLTAVVAVMMTGAMILVRQLRFISPEDLSAAGFGSGFQVFLGVFVFVSTVLLLAPLVWMGCYFHSRAVKRFCHPE